MNIPWGSDIAFKFITNVGLVTTQGPYGHNIMACEWSHHLSYDPALLGIAVHPRHATYDNIKATKEFGVCLASVHQSELISVAGKDSGKLFDKIKIAEELGYKFSSAKKINVLLVENSTVQFECRLYREIDLGDHTLFVGEVVEAVHTAETKPVAYHQGKYWEMAAPFPKPLDGDREKVTSLFEYHKKQINNQ